MMSWAGAIIAKHSPVLLGLAVGSLAKFGRMIATGQQFKAREVVGHVMMMGMVAVVATLATDAAGIVDPNTRTFTAAVLAIACSDVIQYLATRAWQRFLHAATVDANAATEALQHARGEFRQNIQIMESTSRVLGVEQIAQTDDPEAATRLE